MALPTAVHSNDRSTLGSVLGFLLSLSLIGVASGGVNFWDDSGFLLFPGAKFSILLVAGLLGVCLLGRIRSGAFGSLTFSWGLVLLFLSDWLTRGYNFFQGPSIRGEIILGSIIAYFTLRARSQILWFLLPIISSALLLGTFFSESSGRILFSDDHATFFYRLTLLKEHFPNIPFFNPLWNGGIDARDFFATGSLNFFLIFAPLIYLVDLHSIYNLLIGLLVFVLGPLAVYFAARIEKFDRLSQAVATSLALANGLIFFRWALKYGTLGFATSALLIPPVFYLSLKAISEPDELSLPELIGLILCFSLMLCWTPSGIVFIPLILLGLSRCRKLLRKKKIVVLALLIAAINLPWIGVFWSVSNVSSFLRTENAAPHNELGEAAPAEIQKKDFRHRNAKLDLQKSLKVLRENLVSTNPLLFLLALPGIFLLRSNRIGILLATVAWLVLLGAVMVPMKPQLELDRMLLILSMLLVLPVSRSIRELFGQAISTQSARVLIPASLVGGFLLVGPFASAAVVGNRTVEQYNFAGPEVEALSTLIRENTGDGRALFAGFILHELSQGHLAPLIFSSQKPLLASTFVHDAWRYRQIFPTEFLSAGDAGIEEYLNTYNVSLVIAHESQWKNYFDVRPAKYASVGSVGKFKAFRRLDYNPSYFLEGGGEIIKQSTNSVVLKTKTADSVIKFNYLPFLKGSACELSPFEVRGTLKLIRLSNCPTDTEVTINSESVAERVLK